MSFDILRYGTTSSEPIYVAVSDDLGNYANFASVTSRIINQYANTPDMVHSVVNHGRTYPNFSNNELENSVGTAAESKLLYDTTVDIPRELFASPFGLAKIADVVEFVRYERTLRDMPLKKENQSIKIEDTSEMLNVLNLVEKYILAGNTNSEWSQILERLDEDSRRFYDEEINLRISYLQQLLG